MRRRLLNALVPTVMPAVMAVATATVTAMAATPLTAQRSTTRGFVLGVHASGASLEVESQDRNNAGGGGLFLGYGVNRLFTIFAQADAAEFDEQSGVAIDGQWVMGHFDLGVRFHFANSLRSVVPFLQGSIGARAVGVQDPVVDGTPQDEVSLSGGSFTLGGGVDFYFSETFALDLALLFSGGEFDTIHVNNASVSGFDVDATSGRLNVGVTWWP